MNCLIGGKNSPKTDEIKNKIRKTKSENGVPTCWAKGLTKYTDKRLIVSDETKLKQSIERTGRKHKKKHPSESFIGEKNGMYGKKHSIETKNKMFEKVSCPHCGLIGSKHNMHRYHFEKCKYK